MQKEFDVLVFCGRFSPFHLGHKSVIDTAITKAKEVIVVVGSSFAARSLRNPFTFAERKEMIKAEFPQDNVKVVPVSDYPYSDNRWVSEIQSIVRSSMNHTNDSFRIGLIGHSKDNSSYYLNIFPTWDSVEVPNYKKIDATSIRNVLFGKDRDIDLPRESMPEKAHQKMTEIILRNGKLNEKWDLLIEDFRVVESYKKMWQNAPYPPTFVTTDAVLVQNGKILLIERGESPFKGKWALPGGHLEQDITLEDNMLKELKEETRIKVPEKVLRGSISEVKVFDKPNRDPRGRYITHAFYINLGFPDTGFPKVKGDSDAKRASWVDLGSLSQDMMAFDHWHIIQYFLKG